MEEIRTSIFGDDQLVGFNSGVMSFDREFKLCVYEKQRGHCGYCGCKIKTKCQMSLDHVVPRVKGGMNAPPNIIGCCRSCNSKKMHRPLEFLRCALALKESPYAKVLTVDQIKKAILAGASFPGLKTSYEFYFESVDWCHSMAVKEMSKTNQYGDELSQYMGWGDSFITAIH